VKVPHAANQIYTVNMGFSYQEIFNAKQHHPYERLLLDCFKGDPTLFVREDAIEATWKIVDPIIAWWEAHPPDHFPNYEAGTWGPEEGNRLLQQDGRNWISR
jgi:glucose-6-phosphate 1-dehydrogenase